MEGSLATDLKEMCCKSYNISNVGFKLAFNEKLLGICVFV